MAKSTKKAKVKESAKKKAAKKKPGVVAAILEVIQQKGPVSKEQILSKLKHKFPDRPAESMKHTIGAFLSGSPNRMSKEKGVNVVRDKDGNFIVKK